jgi:hypothetical protein
MSNPSPGLSTRAWLAPLVCLGIVACASPEVAPAAPAPRPQAAPPAAMAATAGSFDGTYRGRRTAGEGHPDCPPVRQEGALLTVAGGQVSTRLGQEELRGMVAADGSVSLQGPRGGSLSGKFEGNRFAGLLQYRARTGNRGGSLCSVHYDAVRVAPARTGPG